MDEFRLGAVEARFADIIWQNAPLSSGELVKLCADQLEWKKYLFSHRVPVIPKRYCSLRSQQHATRYHYTSQQCH